MTQTSGTTADSTKCRGRWRAWLRRGVLAAVLLYLGWYVYSRLTLRPPLAPEDFAGAIVDLDRYDLGPEPSEITTALITLSAAGELTEVAAPEGQRWGWPLKERWSERVPKTSPFSELNADDQRLDAIDGLRGPWTPDERPYLRQLLAWQDRPEFRAALAQVDAPALRAWKPPASLSWWLRDSAVGPRLESWDVERVVASLLLECRRSSESGDATAAWRMLEAAHALVEASLSDDFVVLLRKAVREMPPLRLEASYLALAHGEDVALCACIRTMLAESATATDWWHAVWAAEDRHAHAVLEACFTRPALGDGWLCLSAEDAFQTAAFGPPVLPDRHGEGDRPPWRNLLAFCFNGRRTVAHKIERFNGVVHALADLSYADGCLVIDDLDRSNRTFNIVDGRYLSHNMPSAVGLLYDWLVHMRTVERAAGLQLALASYRREHGQYPQQLAELGAAEAANCIDPFGDAPFHYRVTDDGFVLYSVGLDGVDDGGIEEPHMRTVAEHGDLRFGWPRPPAWREPHLEPLPPPGPIGSSHYGGPGSR